MKALMIFVSTIILAFWMMGLALSQSVFLGADILSIGGYAEVDNRISGFSDHAVLQKGNLSYGSTISYKSMAAGLEYLAVPAPVQDTNSTAPPSDYLTPLFGSSQQMFSGVQMEDASGGSYSMTLGSAGQARQAVQISWLSKFNATNRATAVPGKTDISLSMDGTGDYRSEVLVLGGIKGHPIGEGHTKIIGSTFEINNTMEYLL